MGPKPQKPATSKKTDMKKKEKVIEDKTFGLKNKKGAKMQKFVQQVEKQVKFGNNVKASKVVDPAAAKAGKKKEDEDDPMKDLFKPVIVQKAVDKNVDPKSVVCAFFKQGQCTKGDKCKFSHDLSVERKSEKKNLYVDERKDEEGDTMEDWDEAKLEEVVAKKHGKTKPTTDIICKFFLDAVENSKYGWFWDCPNGPTCHYRHALPAGFVLKKDKKRIKELEKEHAITLEELIEEERKKLDSAKCTKVTLESFLAWKRKKRREKKDQLQKAMEQKKKDFKRGLSVGLSGREMFDFDPSLVDAGDEGAMGDDEATFDASAFRRGDDDSDEDVGEGGEPKTRFEFKEIDLAALTLLDDDDDEEEVEKKDEKKATDDEPAGAVGGPIDESLFDADALGLDDDEDELNGVD